MSASLSDITNSCTETTDRLGDDLLTVPVPPPLSNKKLHGQGTFGRVYAAKHSETVCVAKEFCVSVATGSALTRQAVEQVMKSCSKLRHPNIIQFLGVFYSKSNGGSKMPVMVMEMMVDNLASFIDKYQKIPTNIKFSIVHDVSLGLC